MATIDRSEIDLQGRTILVVEDEFMVAFNLCSELSALGADGVPLCGNVQSALDCIDARDRIDAAIVDVNLNGALSIPVIDALQARQIPTILCTGYDALNLDARLSALPHCVKPFTRAAFIRELANVLPAAATRATVQ